MSLYPPFLRRGAITLGLLLPLLGAAPVAAEPVNRIAAVVNDAVITTRQLDAALDEERARNAALRQLDAARLETVRRQLLDRLIEDELLRQRIAELHLTVSDAEVDEAIADVEQQNNLTREQLVAALQQQGMDYATYRRNMHDQILRFKLVGREVQEKVDVSGSAIRAYYEAHLDDYRQPPFLHLAHLVFHLPAEPDPGLLAASRARAEEARRRLAGGDRIEALLVTFREVPGVEGGDMGKVDEKDLAPQFAAAVSGLASGAVSEVVETGRGLFLFKVVERGDGTPRPLEAVREEIERKLLEDAREERFRSWQSDLKKSAYIDIRL